MYAYRGGDGVGGERVDIYLIDIFMENLSLPFLILCIHILISYHVNIHIYICAIWSKTIRVEHIMSIFIAIFVQPGLKQ